MLRTVVSLIGAIFGGRESHHADDGDHSVHDHDHTAGAEMEDAHMVRGHIVHDHATQHGVPFGSGGQWYNKADLWGPDQLGYYYETRDDWINGRNRLLLSE